MLLNTTSVTVTSSICSNGSTKDFALSGSSPFELLSIIESRRLPAMESRLLISRLRREFCPPSRFISRSAAAFSPWKCKNVIKLMAYIRSYSEKNGEKQKEVIKPQVLFSLAKHS